MTQISDFLELGSVEEIDTMLRRNMTDLRSSNGQAAAIACQVLAMREVEVTLKRLDDAATRLQKASLWLAGISLAVAVVGVAVAVIGVLVAT